MTNQQTIQEQLNIDDIDNILLGCYFSNISKIFFEAALLDKEAGNQVAIRGYINKLSFIEKDILSRMRNEEDKRFFREEVTQGDTLLFANIGMTVKNMKPDKRLLFEKFVEAIAKGEAIEVDHADKPIEKTFDLVKQEDRINFLVKGGGRCVGHAYREVDGYYVFDFENSTGGVWSDYTLIEIGNKLRELNKDWDKELKEAMSR